MNLVEIDSKLRSKIVNRQERIAFFVFNREFFWVIDWDENFNLNHIGNIDAICKNENLMRYLPAGKTIDMYRMEVIRKYRGGIPILTSDLLSTYLSGEDAKIVTTNSLRKEFFIDDAGQYGALSKEMELEISFNKPMREELVQLRFSVFSKLPSFYINFDRKIFMHMVRNRSYEKSVLDGWWGSVGDFEHMIPASERYWVRSLKEDFWAATNFSNLDQ